LQLILDQKRCSIPLLPRFSSARAGAPELGGDLPDAAKLLRVRAGELADLLKTTFNA